MSSSRATITLTLGCGHEIHVQPDEENDTSVYIDVATSRGCRECGHGGHVVATRPVIGVRARDAR